MTDAIIDTLIYAGAVLWFVAAFTTADNAADARDSGGNLEALAWLFAASLQASLGALSIARIVS